MVQAYAAMAQGQELKPFEYEAGELPADEVNVRVEYCGVCHSDLSMLDNDWEMTTYPIVPGHEVVGVIDQIGFSVTNLKVGDRVGLGWLCRSCLVCNQCMNGNHHRCQSVDDGSATIVGRHGGFADQVRCQAAWAIKLPASVDPATAGPMFCGGVTVFTPFVINNVKPTDRIGVVGIGGLGHMALGFANKWGCEVTAFSTSPEKEDEAKQMGAHHFLNSRDKHSLASAANSLDMIVVTVNAPLDWNAYVNILRPGGKLHIVGAVSNVDVNWFPMLAGEKAIGGSPTGSPHTIAEMLDFAGRHKIAPIVEQFPITKVNDAMEKLRSGSPRYRLVLKNDLN